MPKASMYKNNCLEFWKNQIRLPRQLLGMKSVTQPATVQIFSNQKFRLGVLTLNSGHHPTTSGRIDNINH